MAAKVFQQFYGILVKTLPMDDSEFRAELFSRNLLHGDNQAKVQSSSITRAEKAEIFLTNEIQPELVLDISTKFKDLLEVIQIYGQEALAKKIKGMYVMSYVCRM